MKKYLSETIKDLIISILLVICIIIIISFIYYDKTAISRVIPEASEYVLSDTMQEELQETDIEEVEEVVVNYYIDAKDLKKYVKNNEYLESKEFPFASVSDGILDKDSTNDITGGSSGYFGDGTK